jgi:ferritin-like metal-binding protein YciE
MIEKINNLKKIKRKLKNLQSALPRIDEEIYYEFLEHAFEETIDELNVRIEDIEDSLKNTLDT